MDEEDLRGNGGSGCFQPLNGTYFEHDEDLDSSFIEQENNDLGDVTFYMSKYLKEAMKMMFMMRSHHMLTDVVLEVGSELFHAHKVVLAAASPYFKVCEIQKIVCVYNNK